MKLWDRIRGLVRVEVCSAVPEAILNACAQREVRLYAPERSDGCTLRFSVRERDLDALIRLAETHQAELRELSRMGGSGEWIRLRRRVGLLVGVLLAAGLLLWSESRIWEIELQGCQTLSRGRILRALSDCGVYEGCYWPSLSQDSVRGRMLLKLPELAWMTVNVSGSRAVVTLVEREKKPEIYRENDAADVVASRSGIVRSLTAFTGRPQVDEGSLVTQGETLVSGTMDSLSRAERQVRASAVVMADTWYECTAALPESVRGKGDVLRVRRRYAIILGKNRINCWLGSRKELDGYDKIVHEYKIGVEGLFSLPLRLLAEEYRERERLPPKEADTAACAQRLRAELAEEIEGQILGFHSAARRTRGRLCLYISARCRENIARTAERKLP